MFDQRWRHWRVRGYLAYLLLRERARLHRLREELGRGRARERWLGQVAEEKHRLDEVLKELPVGVAIAEAPSGRIVYHNHRVHEIYRGRLPRVDSIADFAQFHTTRSDGTPIPPEENPLARALADGKALHGEELRLIRADGTEATLKMNAAPLRDRDGRVVAALAVFDDYTTEKQAQLELARAAHFREMFMGLLGHDLRNPLTVIATGLEALGRRPLDEPSERLVAHMTSSASRMARMIDQLLDFTRSRLGGGIPIERQPADLEPIARDAAQVIEVRTGRRIEVTVEGDTRGEWDPRRLSQVVLDLLANAAEHGRPGTPVHARLSGAPSTVTLDVHNLGAPIPWELVPFLFDPFRRAAERKRLKSTGLGLGLYLAQQIVASHGGRIEVDSSEARGTTFRVVLPRHAEA